MVAEEKRAEERFDKLFGKGVSLYSEICRRLFEDAQFSEIKRNTFELYVQQVLGVDIESSAANMYYQLNWEKEFLGMTPNTIIGIAVHFYKDERRCGKQ